MISTILTAIGYIVCIALIYLLQKELNLKDRMLAELASSIINLELANSNYKSLIANLELQNKQFEDSLNLLEEELNQSDSEYTYEYNLLKDQVLKSIQQLQVSQEILIQKLNDKDII
jgi:hypothetical protein